MVTPVTIQRCQKKAGITKDLTASESSTEVEAEDPEPSDAEDDISPWHAVNEREAAAFKEVQDRWGEVCL